MNAQKEKLKRGLLIGANEAHSPTIFMKPAHLQKSARYVEADFGTRFAFAYKLSSKARCKFVNGVK